jgi:hypothetical protein
LLTDGIGDLLSIAAQLLSNRIAPELEDPYLREQLTAVARLLDILGYAWPQILSEGAWTVQAAEQVVAAARGRDDAIADTGPARPGPGPTTAASEHEAYRLVLSLLTEESSDSAAARREIRAGLAEVFGHLGTIFTAGRAPSSPGHEAPIN